MFYSSERFHFSDLSKKMFVERFRIRIEQCAKITSNARCLAGQVAEPINETSWLQYAIRRLLSVSVNTARYLENHVAVTFY